MSRSELEWLLSPLSLPGSMDTARRSLGLIEPNRKTVTLSI